MLMKKIIYIFFLLLSLLFSCQMKRANWDKLNELMEEKFVAFTSNPTEENYNEIIRICDELIQGSSDYRNDALYTKSHVLTIVRDFDAAVETIEEMTEFPKKVPPFITKSLYINSILYQKNHEDAYRQKIIDEIKSSIESQRDSIYYKIASEGFEYNLSSSDEKSTTTYRGDDKQVGFFIHGIYVLSMYCTEIDEVIEIIDDWKNSAPIQNKNTINFFENLKDNITPIN